MPALFHLHPNIRTSSRSFSSSSRTCKAFRARPSPSGGPPKSTYDVSGKNSSVSSRCQTWCRRDGGALTAPLSPAPTPATAPEPLGELDDGEPEDERLKGMLLASNAHERGVIRDLSARAVANDHGRRVTRKQRVHAHHRREAQKLLSTTGGNMQIDKTGQQRCENTMSTARWG